MKRQIWVAVTNDLVTDQRVNKVCLSLEKAGYVPHLIGVEHYHSTDVKRSYATYRMKMIFSKTALFYAEYNVRLFLKLLFTKFDLVVSNDTDTVLACFLAAKLRRKPIVFDAHELYPEVPELAHRPMVKKTWELIERLTLKQIKRGYTVCQPIADIYQRKYNIEMKVVRNAPMSNVAKPVDNYLSFTGKKMILYQGAVNIGRGIEWMIDAMPLLDDIVFCIAGDGDICQELKNRVNQQGLHDRVFFLGKIPFEELSSYTQLAQLGISLLENRGLNYYYSLPNRIFDFVHADVPVLATDFPEIRSVVEGYGIGRVIDNHTPEYIATTIREMLNEWESKSNKQEIFDKAKRELCWENEEKTLLSVYQQLLGE